MFWGPPGGFWGPLKDSRTPRRVLRSSRTFQNPPGVPIWGPSGEFWSPSGGLCGPQEPLEVLQDCFGPSRVFQDGFGGLWGPPGTLEDPQKVSRVLQESSGGHSGLWGPQEPFEVLQDCFGTSRMFQEGFGVPRRVLGFPISSGWFGMSPCPVSWCPPGGSSPCGGSS